MVSMAVLMLLHGSTSCAKENVMNQIKNSSVLSSMLTSMKEEARVIKAKGEIKYIAQHIGMVPMVKKEAGVQGTLTMAKRPVRVLPESGITAKLVSAEIKEREYARWAANSVRRMSMAGLEAPVEEGVSLAVRAAKMSLAVAPKVGPLMVNEYGWVDLLGFEYPKAK